MKKIEELDYRLHRSFFKILITLPEILMIVTIAGFLMWGIVDSAVFHFEENGQYFYGVMGLPNVFLNCLSFTLKIIKIQKYTSYLSMSKIRLLTMY